MVFKSVKWRVRINLKFRLNFHNNNLTENKFVFRFWSQQLIAQKYLNLVSTFQHLSSLSLSNHLPTYLMNDLHNSHGMVKVVFIFHLIKFHSSHSHDPSFPSVSQQKKIKIIPFRIYDFSQLIFTSHRVSERNVWMGILLPQTWNIVMT